MERNKAWPYARLTLTRAKEDMIPQAEVAVKLQQGDGPKYNEVARDNGGSVEGKPENGRRMLANTDEIPKGNLRLASDSGGESAWLQGKESGASRGLGTGGASRVC